MAHKMCELVKMAKTALPRLKARKKGPFSAGTPKTIKSGLERWNEGSKERRTCTWTNQATTKAYEKGKDRAPTLVKKKVTFGVTFLRKKGIGAGTSEPDDH